MAGNSLRNVVLITVDTLRADHLSVNGYFRETDPRMSEIADRGVTFLNYHGSGTATGMAFSSLVTGLSPINHGFCTTPWNWPNGPQIDDNIPTMAEIFQESGYQTAAVDNLINFRTHPKHFVRGYEYYINPTGTPYWSHATVTGDQLNERVIPWIEDRADEPFFLFMHYWDPHGPYNQPAEYRSVWSHRPGDRHDLEVRRADAGYEYVPGWGEVNEMVEGTYGDSDRSIDLYDGEIRYVDGRIGEVYDALAAEGFLEDTVFAIVGDHGEELGQHGKWGHGDIYDSVTHVPFVLQAPSLPAGETVDAFAEHIDVLPTLMELSGATEVPDFDGDAYYRSIDEIQGASLVPVIEGSSGKDRLFLEHDSNARAVRTEEWTYIRRMETGEEELYDVAADPIQIDDVAMEHPEKTAELREELFGWIEDHATEGGDPMDV